MSLPVQFRNLTLASYLDLVIKAYDSVEDAIDLFVDGMSDEYLAFHHYTLQEHVTTIWFRQRGLTWQVNRASNIRGTVGYERYVKHLWHHDPKQPDEHNVAYRCFINVWEPWVTIKLK